MKTKPAPKKEVTPKPGDIVEIPLPSGGHAYGRVLSDPLMAFYALRSDEGLPAETVLALPVAFRSWVMHSAIGSGRWPVVARAPLEPTELESPRFFKQESISKRLSLYRRGEERPATYEECLPLERAAAWSAEHVEARLEDHLADHPCRFDEAIRAKLVAPAPTPRDPSNRP